MKKYLFIAVLFVFTFSNTYSQDLFFIGEKSYPSTGTFMLKSNMNHGENLFVTIAKKGNGGIINLKTNIWGGNDDWCPLYIRGKAIIYLDNGNVISCIDRGIHDSVDNTTSTVYYLTLTEIEMLKKSNINIIRYSIGPGVSTCTTSQSGNFSASNKSDGNSNFKREKVNVPQLIEELFDEVN